MPPIDLDPTLYDFPVQTPRGLPAGGASNVFGGQGLSGMDWLNNLRSGGGAYSLRPFGAESPADEAAASWIQENPVQSLEPATEFDSFTPGSSGAYSFTAAPMHTRHPEAQLADAAPRVALQELLLRPARAQSEIQARMYPPQYAAAQVNRQADVEREQARAHEGTAAALQRYKQLEAAVRAKYQVIEESLVKRFGNDPAALQKAQTELRQREERERAAVFSSFGPGGAAPSASIERPLTYEQYLAQKEAAEAALADQQ